MRRGNGEVDCETSESTSRTSPEQNPSEDKISSDREFVSVTEMVKFEDLLNVLEERETIQSIVVRADITDVAPELLVRQRADAIARAIWRLTDYRFT
jgi:hypothetical protein